MPICLSHASADQMLERYGREGFSGIRYADPDELRRGAAASWKQCFEVAHLVWGDEPRAIDVLVNSARKRRSSRFATYHLWSGDVPHEMLLNDPRGFFVSSPGFCLVQMARELDLVELCQMTMRYLGCFSPTKTNGEGSLERPPLASLQGLEDAISLLRGAPGTAKASEALYKSMPGARSQREVDLALTFTLPHRFGGFKLPKPVLNAEIELGVEEQRMLGKKSCKVDLLWMDEKRGRGFGVEYNGRLHHEGRFGSDVSRKNLLERKGIALEFVTNEQMKDPVQLVQIARKIARFCGIYHERRHWPDETSVAALIGRLQQHWKR